MNLEQQVSNKEFSLRLRDLGVKQESLFYWTKNKKYNETAFGLEIGTPTGTYSGSKTNTEAERWQDGEIASAFTVAELGEMLPQVQIKKTWCVIGSYQFAATSGWCCDIIELSMSKVAHREMGLTEADARAKMLIYLIENKLITV